jgi:hypothetical protein
MSATVRQPGASGAVDPRRTDKIRRFRVSGLIFEDFTSDYMSVIGMLFSMFGLMMRMKWCAWIAIYCSCIGFASSRLQDDAKQIFSSFMLSISAVVMSYLQNPSPMTLPFST